MKDTRSNVIVGEVRADGHTIRARTAYLARGAVTHRGAQRETTPPPRDRAARDGSGEVKEATSRIALWRLALWRRHLS